MSPSATRAQALVLKAREARDSGDVEYAMDLLEAALELAPTEPATRLLLCETRHEACGKQRAARPRRTSGLFLLARQAALLRRDPRAALAAAERLLRAAPFGIRRLRAHRDAAVAAGMPDAAVQTLEWCRGAQPRNTALLELLLETRRMAKDLQGEYDCLSALVKLEPSNRTRAKALREAAARLALQQPDWSEGPPDGGAAPPAR